ncbi:ABC transporter permease (plasmid) [Methylosinus sp. C49]|uniref:ankyrin repeat domain-containing protein n=1 Tax=Methylosinus sp. C49 TaxID=2699395 RepID=UPI001366C897|nr:ankyrin repeat domain-containing protein [Methylosinus sp. C49]BBU63831.1 ABC transporter permease [Methylosinus sp. C49]
MTQTTLSRRNFVIGVLSSSLLAYPTASVAAPEAAEVFSDPKIVALLRAAFQRNSKRAAELVAAGADVRARGDKNVTLLQWAMLNKSHFAFQVLLNVGADPAQPGVDGDTAIHFAASANDLEYLRLLLVREVDVDTRNDQSGRTPLMVALIGERERQFEMLLAAGARLTHADNMGNTILHVAAQINDAARVLRLLQKGAPAAARNRQGKTFQTYLLMTPERLLNAEARQARREIIDWMTQHGVPVEH